MRLLRPWLVEGRSDIDGAADKEVLKRLARRLADQRKLATWHPDNVITFTDHSVLGPNWHALAPFSSGRIWITNGPHGSWLRYRLSFLLLFAFAAIFSIGVFAWLAHAGQLRLGLKFGGLCFAVLYGANLLIGLTRASYFFDNVARNFDPVD